MNALTYALTILLLLCALPVLAQRHQAVETMPMPSRAVYVAEQCMPAMSRVTVRADDHARDAFAAAVCECRYRLLAPRQEVTARLLANAELVCQAEFEASPTTFQSKYDRPKDEGRRSATAEAERSQ